MEDLRRGIRRPGCTKRLTLIQPTDDGHVESPIVGRESESVDSNSNSTSSEGQPTWRT